MQRRRLLESAAAEGGPGELRRLLDEVDGALHRLACCTHRVCEACGGSIEHDVLRIDPLRRVCLECLSTTERRALEADLELAAEIQGTLAPRGEIRLPGWHAFVHSRAAGTVGGDFTDVVELPDRGKLQFVVGDVSGKGVAAALLASHLQALFRSVAAAPVSLPERVARINRMFAAVTPPQVFATLVWGCLDGDGRAELVNAGHPPVIAVGRDGCRRIESTSVPVGLFAGARFASSTVDLSPGEQLVLVTDGITEAADAAGCEYGIDRLWAAVSRGDLEVSPEESARRYLTDVVRHRGRHTQHDDLTLMVIRRSCCTAPERPVIG